jgi:hypothetical protein
VSTTSTAARYLSIFVEVDVDGVAAADPGDDRRRRRTSKPDPRTEFELTTAHRRPS